MMNLSKCPVCTKKLLSVGIKNHILNMAEGEAYQRMKLMFDYNKSNFRNVSRAVLLRNMPHFGFVRRNTRNKKKFDL